MSLLRRRMMMAAQVSKLFDINTARVSSDSWRNLQYEISNGAVNMISGSYSWSPIYVYLDNCVSGKEYKISFRIATERSTTPANTVVAGGSTFYRQVLDDHHEIDFTCGEDVPVLYLYWSNGNSETIPVTYYDFELIETGA